MNKLIFLILPLLISESKNTIDSNTLFQLKQNNDTTITVFGDERYKLKLHIFNEKINWDDNNATLTFTKMENGKTTILFIDSLVCQWPGIEMHDFNNDKVKDILVFHVSSARSNWMHYLYLVDKKNKKLTRVKGFEDICNPEFNQKEKIISSFTLSGQNYYSFYRISGKNQLIDLKQSFGWEFDRTRDSINYEKTMRAIRKMKN